MKPNDLFFFNLRHEGRMRFVSVFLIAAVAGCGSASEADRGTTDESDLRAMTSAEIVGAITFGETKDVNYAEVPLYRALRVNAAAGDVIDAWVRSDDLDAKLWILDSGSRTLTSNDNAAFGT